MKKFIESVYGFVYMDDLVRDCFNSIALAMELPQSCA